LSISASASKERAQYWATDGKRPSATSVLEEHSPAIR
jgi:hypothetical protein